MTLSLNQAPPGLPQLPQFPAAQTTPSLLTQNALGNPAAQLQVPFGQAFVSLHLAPTGVPASFVVLPVGLESQMVERPTRTVVTQTLGGVCIDSLGAGFPHLTLSGTTGWRVLQNGLDGLDTFKALLGLYLDHMAAVQTTPNDPNNQILVINTADRAYYRCVAMQPMQITRDKDRPLLFIFNWILEIMADLSEGVPRTLPSPAPTTPQGAGSVAGGANPSGQPSAGVQAQAVQNEQVSLAPTPTISYVVQAGDTLQSIAASMYGPSNSVALAAIQANNPYLVTTTSLTVGQVLFLPIGMS